MQFYVKNIAGVGELLKYILLITNWLYAISKKIRQ